VLGLQIADKRRDKFAFLLFFYMFTRRLLFQALPRTPTPRHLPPLMRNNDASSFKFLWRSFAKQRPIVSV